MLNLELQLKLQDRMSAGMKAALRALQDGTKGATREMTGLARAANSVKPNAIDRLIKSLREVKSLSQSAMSSLNKTAQAGAAIAGAGYVGKRALDKPMAYDRQLGISSNVAFGERSVAGRIAGKIELDKAVRAAQAEGMGSQEDILKTLNDLIGSGAMGEGQAGVKSSMNMLPTIAAASTTTGSDPADIAKIVMTAKQNMGMTDEEAKLFLSKAITAGSLGGFEIKDMARYLPEQMASASANGMRGMAGAEDLLAFNQVARITAGNSDQAGNNVVNLLNKMNSIDTQRDFKKQGINLTGSLVAQRAKGVGTLDAFMGLVDNVASKNPEYKKLQAIAAAQTGGEEKQTFEAMMDIMEQQGIGSVIQDRQAMAALLGARQNKAKMDDIRSAVKNDKGGQIEAGMAVINASASASAERLANAKDVAANGALSVIDGPLKGLLDSITSVSTANPVLAASAYAAATALGMVAAGAGVGGLFKLGKGAAAKKGAARVAVGAVAAGAGVAGAGVLASGAAGYAVGSKIMENYSEAEKDNIGKKVSKILALFGNQQAKQNLEINLHIDGQQVTTAVETKQKKQNRRH